MLRPAIGAPVGRWFTSNDQTIKNMRRLIVYSLFILLSLHNASAFAAIGVAEIKSTNEEVSAITGEARFTVAEGGFLGIDVSVTNVWPMGKYDVSIHEFGNCSDEARATGNIFDVKDPIETKYSVHPAGYLGTIDIAQDGTGNFKMGTLDLTLTGDRYSIAGRSIVLEKKLETENNQKTSASRIACGIITITEK